MKKYGGLSAPESLASSAVKTAIDVNAVLIVVMSETGQTARYVAKFRPGCAVVCLTPSPVVARQTGGVLKGVHSYVVDSLEDDVELVRETGSEAVKAGVAKADDLMVIVSGTLHGHGQNNQIRVEPMVQGNMEAPLKRLVTFLYEIEQEKKESPAKKTS